MRKIKIRSKIRSKSQGEKNPTVMPCATVPLNLLETGGTQSAAFDFQSRPVGRASKSRFRVCLITVQGLCFLSRTWQGQSKIQNQNAKELALDARSCSSPARLYALDYSHKNVKFSRKNLQILSGFFWKSAETLHDAHLLK